MDHWAGSHADKARGSNSGGVPNPGSSLDPRSTICGLKRTASIQRGSQAPSRDAEEVSGARSFEFGKTRADHTQCRFLKAATCLLCTEWRPGSAADAPVRFKMGGNGFGEQRLILRFDSTRNLAKDLRVLDGVALSPKATAESMLTSFEAALPST